MPRYDVCCEMCQTMFNVWRSLKQVVPRFCSNKCKGGFLLEGVCWRREPDVWTFW
jgi:hypothetical protein